MRTRSFLLTVLLTCSPYAVHAQHASDAQLQLLYVKSGLQFQLQQLPIIVRQEFDQKLASGQHGKTLDPKIILDLREKILKILTPGTMKMVVLEEFRKRLSREDVEAVLSWFESPLGAKISKLEEFASTPDAIKELSRFAENLRTKPPAQNRLRVLRRLDAAVRATDTSLEIATAIPLALAIAANAILPEERRELISDLRAIVEKSRVKMKTLMNAQVLVTFLYTYQSLTASQLGKYVEFAETDVGRRFGDAVLAGLKGALLNSTRELENTVTKALEARGK